MSRATVVLASKVSRSIIHGKIVFHLRRYQLPIVVPLSCTFSFFSFLVFFLSFRAQFLFFSFSLSFLMQCCCFLSKNDASCQSIATTLVENAACSVVLGARLRALSYKYHTQNNSEMAIPAVCADNLYTAQHNKFSKICETKLYSFALTKLYWCALSQSSGHRSSKRVKWAG